MNQSSGGAKAVRKKSVVRRQPLKAAFTPRSTRRPDIHPLDRAIAELHGELAKSPDDPTLLGRLAALFYRRGDLAEAEKHYRRAISLAPQRASLQNNLGNVLCDMGRMRDGIAAYEHAMAIEKNAHPDRSPSAEAVTNLEMAKTEYRLIHERIEYLERAAQLDVSSAEALNALGCGYLLRGSREKALETFRKAAEMEPRNIAAGLNIAFTHSLNLDGGADLTAALAEVAESVIRFPMAGRLHIHQGELLESAGLLEDAEERYLRAVHSDPRLLEGYDLLGRLREVTGYTNARDEVAKAVEQLLAKLENDAREARAAQGNAAGPVPLHDIAFVEIARARFNQRPVAQLASIDALLREAVTAARAGGTPAGAGFDVAEHASMLRAQLLESDGRRGEARVVLENACTAQPDHARLWFERGSLALRAGDVAEALRSFERATLAAPQDAVAYHSLRFAFEGFRRYGTERVRFEAATRANPRDGLAHHHLAMAALSVLKDEEALFHFTRALELDPRLSDAACGRGRALQRLGHRAEAEAAYVKALDIEPENAEAHRSLLSLRSQKLMDSIGKEPG